MPLIVSFSSPRQNALSSLAKRTWVTYSSIGQATIGANTEEAYFTGNSLFTDGITVNSTSLELIVNNNGRTLPTILTGGDPARQVKTIHSSHGTGYHVFKDFTFAPGTFLQTVHQSDLQRTYRDPIQNGLLYAIFLRGWYRS